MSNLKPGVSQRDIDEQLETGSEPQAETCEKCGAELADTGVVWTLTEAGETLCQRCWEGEQ